MCFVSIVLKLDWASVLQHWSHLLSCKMLLHVGVIIHVLFTFSFILVLNLGHLKVFELILNNDVWLIAETFLNNFTYFTVQFDKLFGIKPFELIFNLYVPSANYFKVGLLVHVLHDL